MYYQSMTTSTAVRLDAIRRVGKALADPTRAAILLALLDGSRYPAELVDELGVTKQTVSNHLACLRDCGIVVAKPSVDEFSMRFRMRGCVTRSRISSASCSLSIRSTHAT